MAGELPAKSPSTPPKAQVEASLLLHGHLVGYVLFDVTPVVVRAEAREPAQVGARCRRALNHSPIRFFWTSRLRTSKQMASSFCPIAQSLRSADYFARGRRRPMSEPDPTVFSKFSSGASFGAHPQRGVRAFYR